ncbi:MAG: PilZ domain-containing protein [Sandaracinaceae bacterium]|nr:PilZ domain-containing protein [Sandaracinaceae bacterium]
MDSHRGHRRYLVNTDCVVRSSADDRLLADETLDLSWSGLRARALGGARVGERVRVSVRVPGSRTWLDADGVVARTAPGRRAGERGETLAVALRRMDGMHRLLLATVVRRFPEVPPERGGTRDYARAIQRIGEEPG